MMTPRTTKSRRAEPLMPRPLGQRSSRARYPCQMLSRTFFCAGAPCAWCTLAARAGNAIGVAWPAVIMLLTTGGCAVWVTCPCAMLFVDRLSVHLPSFLFLLSPSSRLVTDSCDIWGPPMLPTCWSLTQARVLLFLMSCTFRPPLGCPPLLFLLLF